MKRIIWTNHTKQQTTKEKNAHECSLPIAEAKALMRIYPIMRDREERLLSRERALRECIDVESVTHYYLHLLSPLGPYSAQHVIGMQDLFRRYMMVANIRPTVFRRIQVWSKNAVSGNAWWAVELDSNRFSDQHGIIQWYVSFLFGFTSWCIAEHDRVFSPPEKVFSPPEKVFSPPEEHTLPAKGTQKRLIVLPPPPQP